MYLVLNRFAIEKGWRGDVEWQIEGDDFARFHVLLRGCADPFRREEIQSAQLGNFGQLLRVLRVKIYVKNLLHRSRPRTMLSRQVCPQRVEEQRAWGSLRRRRGGSAAWWSLRVYILCIIMRTRYK